MATQFKLEHEFLDIPLAVFEAHLNDPELTKRIKQGLGFDERKLVSHKESKDSTEWSFLVKKHGDMPKALQKIFKDGGLSWLEQSRFVRDEHCIYWDIKPESNLIQFHGHGTWQLASKGAGCKRVIEGSVNVQIPLVGKMIETFIVNELVKTYEIEPTIQREFYRWVMKKDAHAH